MDATQSLSYSVTQLLSHSATQSLSYLGSVSLSYSATRSLSHSATQLSYSDSLPEITQPLSYSVRVSLSHRATQCHCQRSASYGCIWAENGHQRHVSLHNIISLNKLWIPRVNHLLKHSIMRIFCPLTDDKDGSTISTIANRG